MEELRDMSQRPVEALIGPGYGLIHTLFLGPRGSTGLAGR